MKKHYLSKLFEPDSIAIIGASESEGSVGGQVLRNLLDSGFGGALYPVNPKHDEIMGLSAYKSVSGVDLQKSVRPVWTCKTRLSILHEPMISP
ncbi:CoA-binding protein [Solemya velum gill symbiont]|uniref:CoA-binding protein n=1 Tax=Solemya velum gill symbiont TaxID=2340 RepID=UPI002DDCB70E|nr:CoA-binding protein [Solemya velum gill symbiont]